MYNLINYVILRVCVLPLRTCTNYQKQADSGGFRECPYMSLMSLLQISLTNIFVVRCPDYVLD